MIRTAFLAILCLAASAAAAPKIALPAIEGDVTGDMRDAVAAALDGDQLTIIGEKEVNRVYDRLNLENLEELTEKQAKKLSTDLEADAVVTAVLGQKGRSKTLKFRLFVKGKKQRGFTVQFKNAKSSKFKVALRDKVVGRLSGDEVPAAKERPMVATKEPVEDDEPAAKKRTAKRDTEEDEEDPNPKKKEKAEERPQEDDDDEDPKKKKGKKVAARDDDEELDEETAIEKRMEPKHSANRVAARLDAGMSFGNRSLVFTNRANFPEGPKPFRSSPVPGARFEAEVYPFAFVNPDSILSGVGGAVDYDKTIIFNLGTAAEPGKKIKVDQSSYTLGGRFRYAFGKRATSPTVTVGFDYGRRRFKADRSVLEDRESNNGLGALDLPDTHYTFTAPGLGFRIPLGTAMIALAAYGKGMFVSNAGPIQKAEMYGKAKIFGVQGEAGLDVVIANRVAVKAMFEITQFGYTLQGSGGALANSRDMDPMSRDIGGARDRSLGGVVTVGVLY
jgi:hypothetical protein